MTTTELAAALGAELRAILDEDRRAHAETLQRLQTELAELRGQLRAMPNGPAGPGGPQGDRGPEGVPGRDGRDALPVPGPRGEPGAPGKDGHNGKDGRDGVTEERFLAEFDKRFAGVQAACDERIDKRIELRTVVPYLGVYVPGTEYQRGRFVTFGGSVWHCDKTTTAKPGDGNDWTLAVKHGRDGRDR